MRKGTFIICLFCLLVLLFSPLKIAAQETDYILFDRDGKIILSSIDGKQQKELIYGEHPDPSPNGQKIAYTLPQNDKGIIAVYDMQTKQTDIFKNIPGNNNYRPVWSPDGSKLAFYHQLQNKKRQLALINSDGTQFKVIFKFKPNHFFWDIDGQHIWVKKAGAGSPMFYQKQGASKWQHLTIMTSETDMVHGSKRRGAFITRSTSMTIFGKGEKKETRKIMWDKVLGSVNNH